MLRSTALFVFVLTLLAAPPLQAQRAPGSVKAWEHEISDVAPNERIHFGHLDNGMRYAWMANPEPNERSYVRLHVDVGSLAETEAEAGMAHFLEHMAFNGSENFEAGTLVEWFQSHGMSFGADTNASTGFSQTVYMLNLPYSNAETLDEGLTVLRDFADRLILDAEEVEAEKGVIDGEERERDSAQFRAFMQSLERQYAGTIYPDKLPIGNKEARDAFDADAVRAFYQRWYRPENMTLVLVGDLEDLDPVPMIEQHFADMAGPDTPILPEPDKGTPTLDDLFFNVYESEVPQLTMQVEMLEPFEEEAVTVENLRARVPLRMARRMLNLRFSELAKEPDSPFLSANSSRAGGLKVFDGETLTVRADPAKWEQALIAADTELRRALEFGFQQAELDEVRAEYLRGLDEAVEREATAHSGSWVGRVLTAAEDRSVPMTAETAREISKPAFEAATIEACHEAFKEAWTAGALSLTAVGNLDLGEDGGAQLRAVLERGREQELERGEEIAVAAFAYASEDGLSGEVKSREHVEDLDVWLIEFANGVRLNVKQTDFKDNEIIMRARLAEGGLTLDAADYTTGFVGGAVVNGGGLVEHSEDDLRRILAGKRVGVGFGMAEDYFSLTGTTTPEDVLLEFELLCAHLQHPGWRDEGLNQLRQQLPLQYQQLEVITQGPLLMEFLPALYGGNERMRPFPEQDKVMAVEVDDVRDWLSPHLADGPLEVTVIGDLDVDVIVDAAARTLGRLPPRRAPELHADRRKIEPAKAGLRMERSVATQVPKSLVFMAFPTTDSIEADRRRGLSFLGTVVNDRIRIEVRERLGASYSPGAGAVGSRTYPGVGLLQIQANADPEEVQTLVDACLEVARDLAENGVTDEELDRLREPVLAQLRDARRNNNYWVSVLAEAQSDRDSLDDIRSVEDFYLGLSAETISEYAGKYLDPERASVLVVNPEVDAAGS